MFTHIVFPKSKKSCHCYPGEQDIHGGEPLKPTQPVAPPCTPVVLADFPTNVTGTVGQSVVVPSSVTGTAPVTYEINPPVAGFAVSPTGVVAGTPSAPGTLSITVVATNACGSSTKTLSVNVTAGASAPVFDNIPNVTVCSGTNYSMTPNLTAGTAPVTWSFVLKDDDNTPIVPNVLPAGLTFDPSTGKIEGTPTTTTANTFNIDVIATNAVGSSTKTFEFRNDVTPVFEPIAPINLTENVPLTTPILTPSSGLGPKTYQIIGNPLPDGLQLEPNGQISGTPTVSGTFTPTLQATNGCGSGQIQLTINIASAAPLVLTVPGTVAGFVGQPWEAGKPTVTGATGAVTFTAPTLPAGLQIDPNTGVISGTPTAPVTPTGFFNVTATDSSAPTPKTATVQIGIGIVAQPNPSFNLGTVNTTSGTATPATGVFATMTPAVNRTITQAQIRLQNTTAVPITGLQLRIHSHTGTGVLVSSITILDLAANEDAVKAFTFSQGFAATAGNNYRFELANAAGVNVFVNPTDAETELGNVTSSTQLPVLAPELNFRVSGFNT